MTFVEELPSLLIRLTEEEARSLLIRRGVFVAEGKAKAEVLSGKHTFNYGEYLWVKDTVEK